MPRLRAIIVRRLVNGQFDDAEVLRCPECGWEVACWDYHKSLLGKAPSRPSEPARLYKAFVPQWPMARSAHEELLQVDRLIHEWHTHYRAVGWPIGTSVVRATAKEMVKLLEELAYGPSSADGLAQTRAVRRSRLQARRMEMDLKAAASALGIEGISRMRKHELIKAIERADPRFFAPCLELVYGSEAGSAGRMLGQGAGGRTAGGSRP